MNKLEKIINELEDIVHQLKEDTKVDFRPETIWFQGFEYKTVQSATGRIWLDRNLGASRVAQHSTDSLSYGGYYNHDEIQCPAGFRLPTEEEWKAEIVAGNINISPLKLPRAGLRYYSDGSLGGVGSYGYYWSSTVYGSNVRLLYFNSNNTNLFSNCRSLGVSVRLIKD